jgi:hypothetical protein
MIFYGGACLLRAATLALILVMDASWWTCFALPLLQSVFRCFGGVRSQLVTVNVYGCRLHATPGSGLFNVLVFW